MDFTVSLRGGANHLIAALKGCRQIWCWQAMAGGGRAGREHVRTAEVTNPMEGPIQWNRAATITLGLDVGTMRFGERPLLEFPEASWLLSLCKGTPLIRSPRERRCKS